MSQFQNFQQNLDDDSESGEQQPWIDWYCSLKGNEFFVRVEDAFIQDSFNLTGLDSHFRYYIWALDMILDQTHRDTIPQDQLESVEEEAEQLFGLVHARYIITQRGLEAMLHKFKRGALGRCPRVLCNGQPTLPVGLTPMLGLESVRLYCPRCDEIYASKSSRHIHIDGAFFGPTFPHLFLLAFPELKPDPLHARYVPRVFGFRLNQNAYSQSLKYKQAQEEIEGKAISLQTQLKSLNSTPAQSTETIQQVLQQQTSEYRQMTAQYLSLYQPPPQEEEWAWGHPPRLITHIITNLNHNHGDDNDEFTV